MKAWKQRAAKAVEDEVTFSPAITNFGAEFHNHSCHLGSNYEPACSKTPIGAEQIRGDSGIE